MQRLDRLGRLRPPGVDAIASPGQVQLKRVVAPAVIVRSSNVRVLYLSYLTPLHSRSLSDEQVSSIRGHQINFTFVSYFIDVLFVVVSCTSGTYILGGPAETKSACTRRAPSWYSYSASSRSSPHSLTFLFYSTRPNVPCRQPLPITVHSRTILMSCNGDCQPPLACPPLHAVCTFCCQSRRPASST